MSHLHTLPNPLTEHIASLGLTPPSKPLGAAFFDPPSTPLAKHAQGLVEATLPSFGINHCYRTYAFGLAIATLAGWTTGDRSKELGWDRETWFLTAILHDLGWDEVECHKSRLSFEIFGGIKAREFLMKWKAPQDVADEACEGIIRHTANLSPAATGSTRIAGALCSLGALHDLIGYGSPAYIHPEDNRIICERWPRLGLIEVAGSLLSRERALKPGCMMEQVPDMASMMRDVACFDGLQGVPTVDEGWEERRKAVSLECLEG